MLTYKGQMDPAFAGMTIKMAGGKLGQSTY